MNDVFLKNDKLATLQYLLERNCTHQEVKNEVELLLNNLEYSKTGIEDITLETDETGTIITFKLDNDTSKTITIPKPTYTASEVGAQDSTDADVKYNTIQKRISNRTSTDGVGYILLDNNESFIDLITSENTIYEIRYDFNLEGKEVSIPKGSILQFEGGYLKNGTITGNNTIVKAQPVRIFQDDLTVNGTWFAEKPFAEWYGANGDGVTTDTKAISNTLITFKTCNLLAKTYYLGTSLVVPEYAHLCGESMGNTILSIADDIDGVYLYPCAKVNDLTIYINGGTMNMSALVYDSGMTQIKNQNSGSVMCKNIRINFNSNAQANKYGTGVLLYSQQAFGVWHCIFENIDVMHAAVAFKFKVGKYITGKGLSWINSNEILSSRAYGCRCAVKFDVSEEEYNGGYKYNIIDNIIDVNFQNAIQLNTKVMFEDDGQNPIVYDTPTFTNDRIYGNKIIGYAWDLSSQLAGGCVLGNINIGENDKKHYSAYYHFDVATETEGEIEYAGRYILLGTMLAYSWATIKVTRYKDYVSTSYPYSTSETFTITSYSTENVQCKERIKTGAYTDILDDLQYVVLNNVIYIYARFKKSDTSHDYEWLTFDVVSEKAFTSAGNIVELNNTTVPTNTGTGTDGIAYNSLIVIPKYTKMNLPLAQAVQAQVGASTARPVLGDANKGFVFYDATLNKPIWWNGSAWTDATGIALES